MSFAPNTLYYGDCLDWMSQWDDRCVDLIYLDPPFNSNQNYSVLFSDTRGELAQYRAFSDTWNWDTAAQDRLTRILGAVARPSHQAIDGLYRILGESGMLAYLTYMAERLEEMHRLLKPTGSIYLHCDPTASHYLKVILDSIFGADNFRNEVVWKRYGAHNDAKTKYGRVHDILLYYSVSDKQKWNRSWKPLRPEYVKQAYRHRDRRGRYRTGPLHTGGLSGGGYEYEFRGHKRIWKWPEHRMVELADQGLIRQSRGGKGVPERKVYLKDSKGRPVSDWWGNIKALTGSHKERLGYPTQKPLKLLQRIIEASSNPGDMVLDPFCGCGTAIDAASRLDRRWNRD